MVKSDEDIIVKVTNLSKTFRLPHEKTSSIKSALIRGWRKSRTFEKQVALDDITFEVKKGDFFGIVGRNGSGKSTLLKLLAGIYSPSKGNIEIHGTLTPFIELGVGFNPELTGRENVYLNGALLGFNRKQMSAMYNDIVNFAELERFMDQKLKNYSSGMQVRLAFSIAIRAQSDILILDEVLAVGDESFQRKCLKVFDERKARGDTIIIVTHDMSVVEKYCNRAILISNGQISKEGDPIKIARQYSQENAAQFIKELNQQLKTTEQAQNEFGIKYGLYDNSEKRKYIFEADDDINLVISWKSPKIQNIGVALSKDSGEYIYGTNTYIDGIEIKQNKIKYKLHNQLSKGDYHFLIGFFGKTDKDQIYFTTKGLKFSIISKNKWVGLVKVKQNWYV